jgi:prolyl oligopeptidase
MIPCIRRAAAPALLAALSLLFAACSTLQDSSYEPEAPFVSAEAPAPPEQEDPEQAEEAPASLATEGEVPLSVAESEIPEVTAPPVELDAIIVTMRREDQIRDLVSQARALLEDYELEYVFTGKKKNETLRGRPVAFALWSEAEQDWIVAKIEIPRPPVSWKPGGKPLKFTLLTPGIQAQHMKGTGAERLMFTFSKDGEPLKVYGRKFPVFDAALIKKKRWRAVAETAQPIVYLPFTEDTFDPEFVAGGREFLLSTAQKAIDELRLAKAPSTAFPGELLAEVVPPAVIATLAVIEQTDDNDFVTKGEEAFNEVLNQYGLKRGEAYRYSVSRASAIGPMQFTNRRGNGTYSLVVRRCPAARLDPNFERGATDLLNAMKAAICLFDIELKQMRPEIRAPYRDNREVMGIFPVAAYNGGPRNVTKLAKFLKRMKVDLTELGRPGEQPAKPVPCPCVWKTVATDVLPVTIPRYNNENRWYIEKYQSILHALEEGEPRGESAAFASSDAADPYLWLEEIDSARALGWVREKNAATRQKLATQPIYEDLRQEALAALDSPSRLPDVEQMGPWIYNLWKDDAHPRGIYRRATLEEFRKPEPAWVTVLDIDELSERENTPWVFHGMECLPPAYTKCLVSLSPGGGDADEVREFDPETLAFISDGFFVPTAKTSIAWRDADSVFLGTDFGSGSMTDSGYPRQVRLWTRGTSRARAPVLYETKPESVRVIGFRLRSDGGDVDLIADGRTFYETDYYQLLRNGSLHRLELPPTAEVNDAYAGRLIVTLHDDWQRGDRKFTRDSILVADPAVLRATGEGAGSGAIEVLAESSGSEVVLGAAAAKSGILVTVLDNVRGRLYRYEQAASGWTRRQIALPDNGSLGIESVDGTSGDAFVTFEDFVTPPTLYYVADANPVPEPVKQQAPTFDGSRFEVSQHWAISADGTRVPYFQVAPKEMVLDGSRPTHIFSYGGFRSALVPSYSGSYEQLYGAYGRMWLERGGVFVLANIRGGGEFGEAWHQGAVKANHVRSFEDFEAIAADLIARKVTSKEHLGIEGRSNGGLLALSTMVRRPDLYGAVISGSSLADMRRYHRLLAGASWMDEFGDPDKPEEWAWIAPYSPYQNAKAALGYPPIFFYLSTRDDRVHPGHARKMAARLEELGYDVSYYEEIEGGHGASVTNEQLAHRLALSYTHLWMRLGVRGPVAPP